jgi:hypothetical protein
MDVFTDEKNVYLGFPHGLIISQKFFSLLSWDDFIYVSAVIL